VIKRETATLKAFEAVPLAGTAVELVAEMAGLTESMQRAQTAMDLQIESGRQLYAAQIEAATKWGPAQTQFAVQMATLKGDKIGAITADTQGKISDEKAQEADFRKAYLKKTEDMIKDQFGTGPSSTMSAIGQVADYANMPRRALLGGFTPPSAMQDWSDKVEQFRAERERQFKAEFAKQFNPNAVSDDTTLGDAQKQIARAQQKAFLIASQGRAVMAKDQAEAFALLQHGDSRAAMLKRQQGERDALAANQKAEYTTFQGSRPERRAMQAEQRAEAKKLNAQQQDELANADRSRTADSISALGAAAASKLRISGQFYKADVAEYKATETAKIATMTDFNAKLAEQMRANAHLADMDAQHSREVARQTAQLQIDASTAVLRAQHRDRAAAIVEFEAQTTAMAKANPENAGTIQAQRAIQEGALKQQQDEQLALESGALRARTQEAGYRARGQSRVAETFAELQRMREEQIKAPAELRSRLAVAQIAELRADQMAVLRPNQYARQADPWHEAYGGPHGNAQAETLQQLKLIADRLKVLVGGQKAAQQDWQINNAFAGMGL
jgi:hypothetical protein